MKNKLIPLAALAAAFALAGCSAPAKAASSPPAKAASSPPASGQAIEHNGAIVIAEPVHNLGYLPLYAAIDQGYFTDAGLDVQTSTLGGGAHVNALLSGDVWAFIGGLESAAIANAKGADLIGIAGVVDRANVYWTAAKGVKIDPNDLAGSLKGLRIAASRHAGSPEIDTLYELKKLGLDPAKDVTIVNNDSGTELALIQSGQADIAVTSEPNISKGISGGLWSEPIMNLPKELGKFAYSDIVVSKATVAKEPHTVQAFVDALNKGMHDVLTDRSLATRIAKKEFPTMSDADIKATLDRSYNDGLWDGIAIDASAVKIDLTVARDAGLLQDSAHPATFDSIVDTEFFTNTK
ncbi:ABC transporter substrate-binding protein [Demequina lutea]|uniref:NitT/TauT family transport system substrate-binding protein n=1 Tax=Demequina lutea TaxID=431489 RepID=A0A7Y9ZAN2_9MICO|nr:ABC transporter substrate-binding protein [Demequina lutea]NYI41300.1 NitT/TauT family transport system substrate-binding protein [Demequina lutea]